MQTWRILPNSIVCLFIFCTGCVSVNHYDQPIVRLEPLKGKLFDDKYHSADDTFWIEVPAPAAHGFVIDDKGCVSFLNRYNYFYKLEVIQPQLDIVFLLAQHPEEEKDLLNTIFSEKLLPGLISKTPDARVLVKDHLSIENARPVLFAMVNFPSAAITVDCWKERKEEKMGSVHGIFLTFSDDYHLIYMQMQNMHSLYELYEKDIPDDLRIKYTKDWLLSNLKRELNNIHFQSADLPKNDIVMERS